MISGNHYFDVCIVCALAEEAEAVLKVISRRCRVVFEKGFNTNHNYEYRYTTIQNNRGEPVTLHVSWLPDMGPLETALHFKPIIEEFRPRFVAMTGICAGDKRKVSLGDLVIADRAFLYDTGKFVTDEDGRQVHLQNVKTYNVNPSILQAIRLFDAWKSVVARLKRPPSFRQQRDWLLSRLLKEAIPQVESIPLEERKKHAPDWRRIIEDLQNEPDAYLTAEWALKDKSRVDQLRYGKDMFPFQDPRQLELHIAPMASGNAVRSDRPFKDVQVPVRSAIAIDMEGAAFYRTTEEFPHICSLLVKGICDYADKDKDDTYHHYASEVSAVYVLCFIQEYVTEERMPRSQGWSTPTNGDFPPSTPTTHLPRVSQTSTSFSAHLFSGSIDYVSALERLGRLLSNHAPDLLADLLIYENRLRENVTRERRYGSTETVRAERAEIVDRLNDLAQRAQLSVSFNDLTMGITPER